MKPLERVKKIIALALITLFLFNLTSSAQAQGGGSNQAIKFEHLTIEDGLSSNFTYAVLQDKQGFMWFGTRDGGLSKYDGAEFTTYTHDSENPNSMGNNYVWYLLEDSHGMLWICFWGGGLDRFDPVTETFTHYQHDETKPDSLSNNLVWSVYEDRHGTLWVATDGGLDKFDPVQGTFIHYRYDANNPQSLSSNSLTQMAENPAGHLWIGTYGGGLNKFDPVSNTVVRYQHDPNKPNSLGNDFIWSIYVDGKGIVWLGTEGGMDKFDPVTETFTHYRHDKTKPNSLSHDTVSDIYEDDTGMLWVSTFSGLNKFDPLSETFSRYLHDSTDPNSLSNDFIWYIDEDNTGTLWATTDGGVNKYDPGSERFTLYRHNSENPTSLNSDLVNAIYEDDKGLLWLGTKGGGLNRFDRESHKFVHYQHEADKPNSLSDNDVMAIQPDSDGMLWLATEGGGFNKFDSVQQSFTRYQHDPNNPNSLDNDNVVDMDLDSTGTLWIGTYGGGLNKFDPKNEIFKHYTQDASNPNSLASLWVRTVYVDSKGYVWVGSEGALSRFEPKGETFTNYLPNDAIGTIYEDSRGTIWIGTNDGLNKFDNSTETFTVYREKQGLAGNAVNSILEDNHGLLWVGTNKGLSRFEPQHETFRNYDEGDGLQSNLFLLHSAYKGRNGELFFGGPGGFNAFYPDKLVDNLNMPVVVLTEFQLFNRPVPIGGDSPLSQHINRADQITLSYNQSVFSFKFAALNYRAPQKNHYAYMMAGFDQDWTYVNSNRRFASYTNLDPGSYTFKVKASNNDNVWNEEGTSIKITIVPPFWRTWWFQLSLGLLAFGVVFGGFTLRTRAIESQKRHLEKVVAERTVELEAQALQLQESKRNAEQARARADQANQAKSEFLSNMSHELRTPLNGILGYAQIIKRRPDLDKELRNGLDIIHQSGDHLLTLINDVLDLAKIEARKMELYLAPLHLPNFVDGVVGMMYLRATQKGLTFTHEASPNLPTGVMVDEKRLRQVLLNLLGNAIKFTDKGQITLRVSEVTHALSAPETGHALSLQGQALIRFEVIDTGVGMSPDDAAKIFTAFEQVGDTKKRAEGTGLGLTITKQLVELMGGELQVKSRLGEGTTFWFEVPLPLEQVHEADIHGNLVNQIRGYEGKRRKVLIVDDNLNNRLVLTSLLEPLGFELAQAEDGLAGLELAQAMQPDLMITDLVMPRLNGDKLIELVRVDSTLSNTKIIMVSASSYDFSERLKGITNSDGFLAKPIDINRLFGMMVEVLGLTWLYDDAPMIETASMAELVLPPATQLEAWYKLAEVGDLLEVEEQALALAKAAPQYQPFVTELCEQTAAFKVSKVMAFLEQFVKNEEHHG